MPSLLLCMSPGVSLAAWVSSGIFGRESLPVKSLAQEGWRVKILTYRLERAQQYGLPANISTVPFPHHRLLCFLPYLHSWLADMIDVIQTNQSLGAWYYVQAAHRWNKPILLRCGFVYGEGMETMYGLTKATLRYQKQEAEAFRGATLIEVPTQYLAEWVMERYGVEHHKLHVVPNFVDTELFRPLAERQYVPNSVVSVGTLHPVKRFDLMLQACALARVSRVTIYGDGPSRADLVHLARRLGIDLHLPGIVHNEQLPSLIQRSQIFVITSKREGHPKALVEAMACEMPCVGVDVVGVREVMQQSGAGLLVNADPESVGRAIRELLDNPQESKVFGQRGRSYVEASLNYYRVLAQRKALLETCLRKGL